MKTTANQIEFVSRLDGKKLSQEEQARLADALDKVDFEPLAFKACEFVPGVEYRFTTGGKAVALQVCFKCNDLLYLEPDGKFLSNPVDFGRVKPELLAMAKATFPGDAGLDTVRPQSDSAQRK